MRILSMLFSLLGFFVLVIVVSLLIFGVAHKQSVTDDIFLELYNDGIENTNKQCADKLDKTPYYTESLSIQKCIEWGYD